MPIERSYATSYLLSMVMFLPSVTILEIFIDEMCTSLRRPLQWAKVKYKYINERPHATSYVLAIAMFSLSVTVCEIIEYEHHDVLDPNLRRGKRMTKR